MQALASSEVFLFEDYRLDRRGGGLFQRDGNGGFVPVALGSRGLDILGVLIERAGEVISKDEIIAAVWPGMVVEDSNLTVQISALRRVLDRGRSRRSCIQTVPGRGYRFVVAGLQPVAEAASAPSPVNDASLGVACSAIDASVRWQLSRSLQRIGSTRRLDAILAPAIAAVVGAAFVLAASEWWLWPAATKRSPTPEMSATTSISRPLVAPRLSIVVLPFANLSNDPEQQYFADGITEDLTTDLSRIQDSFVISRNTAFTYRNKPIETKQIGRELGVRYVLEGSVRRSSDRVRVSAQLINADADAHLWAEHFDRDMGDLIALQNEITRRIAGALHEEMIAAEAARAIEHPDALDYIFRGRAAGLKPWSREGYDEAIRMFQRALELDPHSTEAQTLLAVVLTSRVLGGVAKSPAADIARAEALAEEALAAAPRGSPAHFAKGQVLRAQHRYTEAIPEYETAIALDRNHAGAMFALGLCKLYTGSIEETIPLEEQAIRLSPRDPQVGLWYQQIGRAHLLQSRTDEAIRWFERARIVHPGLPFIHAELASAYGLEGDTERGAAELAEARRLSADDRYTSIARLKASGVLWAPKIYALAEATYLAGLRKAGMPEE